MTSHKLTIHHIASRCVALHHMGRVFDSEEFVVSLQTKVIFVPARKKTFWHCLKLFSRWPLLKTRPQKKRRMREFESLERFYDSSGARLFVRLTAKSKSSPKTWLVKMRETVALHCSKTFENKTLGHYWWSNRLLVGRPTFCFSS